MADSIIKVSPSLDKISALELVNSLHPGSLTVLDFSDVENVNFGALRALVNARNRGCRLCIVNVNDEVAEKFEDTGVASLIPVSRKPKKLDISRYKEFGESFLSKAYYSDDGDSMMKIYGERVPLLNVAREKVVAKEVFMFGISTPLVGTLYVSGDLKALDYERIEGKRSFSRIISEEPHRLEEISRLFAVKCKELHSKQCDTTIFDNRTLFYKDVVNKCSELSEEEKDKIISFIDSVPVKTTCLHGDMQLSNIIVAGNDILWIDLSDFGYGNPLFDMGMWFFMARMNIEPICQKLFHLGLESLKQIWEIFAKEYFGADTPEKQQDVEKMVMPFAALHMLYLGVTYGFEPHMFPLVKKIFFGKQ